MTRGLFGPGTIILGGGAVLLVAVLAVGFFLPSEWAATAQRRIAAPPETVLEFLDSPEGWQMWTTWPDSGLVREGPDRGAGARIAWADRELGDGSFSITSATSEVVRYAVEVDGAAGTMMVTRGTITLEPLGDETLVDWTEEGDLGRNPLMGFWGLSMEQAQSAELAKSLDQLAAVVGGDPVGANAPRGDGTNDEAPADSGSTGA